MCCSVVFLSYETGTETKFLFSSFVVCKFINNLLLLLGMGLILNVLFMFF